MSDQPRDDVTEEQLDEASEGSFPASDPPAYTDPVENRSKPEDDADSKDSKKSKDPKGEEEDA